MIVSVRKKTSDEREEIDRWAAPKVAIMFHYDQHDGVEKLLVHLIDESDRLIARHDYHPARLFVMKMEAE